MYGTETGALGAVSAASADACFALWFYPLALPLYNWDSVSDFFVLFGVGLLHLDLVLNVPETNLYYDLSCPAG